MLSKIAQTLSLVLVLCGTAQAEESDTNTAFPTGQFTILDVNQRAPFRGTLFDPAATAHILTIQPRLRAEFQIELDYQLSELTAQHQLELDNLDARYSALDEEYRLRIEAKDMEIAQLNASLSKLSRNDRHWFVIGGFAIGVGVTAGIVAAINSASN
tara:strand:- start:1128 stop:1598 length:471 start_codon:yes stop_codon:yes gene_type:complete